MFFLPHILDFATPFHGLYVVRGKNVLSLINGSLFCFRSGFPRTREGHVHRAVGLALPSAVQPRERHGRAEAVS